MKSYKLAVTAILLSGLIGLTTISAQPPTATPEPQTPQVSREKREQAYAKLLEAQRYLWQRGRMRMQTNPNLNNNIKLAKQALQKSLELNPNLAESYTMLAEISLRFPPNDIEEAILQATIATKINPDNFGARRILARIYTIKSRIAGDSLEPNSTAKAIGEWKEIVRLDPKNAEAWAFLSLFYERQNRSDERIEVLKKWVSAVEPMENEQGFYRTMLGRAETLSPETAALKLGDALIKAGKNGEAVEILSRRVADEPENALAIDLLRQAIQGGESKPSNATVEMLKQAVFANPTNTVLVELLSDAQISLGKTDDAVKTLKNSIQNSPKADKNTLANLQISLGDIYLQANRHDEAISSYEQALTAFGIEKTLLTTEDQREFAVKVFEKIIRTYKNAGKAAEAKSAIERARILLGKEDLFADKQLISLLRESGRKDEALQAVRSVRKKFAEDYPLLRTEATILTETGRVEEGVALINNLIKQKSQYPSAYYDDFSNYLFISSLYSQAKKPKEAIETAQKAVAAAESQEKKQLANISLANAQHQSGNHQQAETTLRTVLKQMPDNPIALNNLGYYLLERNERIDEAVSLIEQALKIDPTNSSYLDSLGWGYYKLGKLPEAERYLKQAIRYNPASANTFEHLGDVYLKQGNPTLAQSAWQKALSFSSDLEAKNRIKAKMSQRAAN
jgi:tetratricopeptide (TPR) repeat protein